MLQFPSWVKPESVKAKSIKREKKLAKKFGMRRIPMSGAIRNWKGDLEDMRFKGETKHSGDPNHWLKTETITAWMTIKRQARSRMPFLIIEDATVNLVLLDTHDFLEMKQRCETQ